MLFIARLSKVYQNIQIRIFDHNGEEHLCNKHKSLPIKKGQQTNIKILTGALPVGHMGTHVSSMSIRGQNMDIYCNDKNEVNICLHMHKEVLESKSETRCVLEEMLHDIENTQGIQRSLFSMAITSDMAGKNKWEDAFLAGLREMSHPGMTAVPCNMGQGEKNTALNKNCICYTCTGPGNEYEMDARKFMATQKNISTMDFIQEDQCSINSDQYPREDDQYSTITEVEDIIMPEACISNMDENEDKRPLEDTYDYSKTPKEEHEFLRWLIRTFSHILSNCKNDRK
jgi:hypothetical protein